MNKKIIPCEHQLVSPERAIWVRGGGEVEGAFPPFLKRRYCIICGKIHYIGAHHGRKLGYWVNVISEIKKVTEVLYKRDRKISKRVTENQKRLIIKELQEDWDFQDLFSVTFGQQQMRVEAIIKKYTGINEKELDMIYERMGIE